MHEQIYDDELSFDWFISTLFYQNDACKLSDEKDKKKLAKTVVKKFNIKSEKYWSKIIKENNYDKNNYPTQIAYRNFLRELKDKIGALSNYWILVNTILEIIDD